MLSRHCEAPLRSGGREPRDACRRGAPPCYLVVFEGALPGAGSAAGGGGALGMLLGVLLSDGDVGGDAEGIRSFRGASPTRPLWPESVQPAASPATSARAQNPESRVFMAWFLPYLRPRAGLPLPDVIPMRATPVPPTATLARG